MEKVRSWCGQPSDRGRLRNRTEQCTCSSNSSNDDDNDGGGDGGGGGVRSSTWSLLDDGPR